MGNSLYRLTCAVRPPRGSVLVLLTAACLGWAPLAQAQAVTYTTPLEAALNALLRTPAVPQMLGDLGRVAPLVFEEQKRLTAIPAPPFKEAARAVTCRSACAPWACPRPISTPRAM